MLIRSDSVRRHLHIRKPFGLLLICATILSVYYASVFGQICKVDDVDMYNSLMATKAMNFGDYLRMFIPTTPGIYYRPLLMTTFYMDRFFINLDTGFMKLENIMLHLVNALLVYWLAYQLLPHDKKGRSFIPLISALFFGVHPVNTESVNWISGRTDVLACTFILFSANFLIKFKCTGNIRFLVFSAFSMILGYMSKETALAFFPGALLIMNSGNRQGKEINLNHAPLSSSGVRWKAMFSIFTMCAAVIFLALRYAASTSTDDKFGFTLKIILSDIPYSTFIVLNALGFYLKKIFLPFPLNLAIIETDPLYDFLGLPLVIWCLYLLSRRTMISALFLSGVFLIIPAFLIAFKQIAWTPYAERYAYIASSFVVVASVFSVGQLWEKASHPFFKKEIVVLILLVVATVGTVQRNVMWERGVALYQDMVEQNPNFSLARALYGFALAERGDLESARIQFHAANAREGNRIPFNKAPQFIDDVLGYWEDGDLGLSYILEREGKQAEAAQAYECILKKSNGKSEKALKRLIPIYVDMLAHEERAEKRNMIKKKLYFYTSKKYNYKDGRTIYLIGKILLLRGEREGAARFFARALEGFERDPEFMAITSKLLKRLGYNSDHGIYKTS